MKKRKGLKIFGIILLVIVLFFVTINVIPPKANVENNPFIVGEGELPMIAAHRGGGDNNPENTMLAFREAVNTIGVSVIEILSTCAGNSLWIIECQAGQQEVAI